MKACHGCRPLCLFCHCLSCNMGFSYIYLQIPLPPSRHHSTQKTKDKGCVVKGPVCMGVSPLILKTLLPGFRAPFLARHGHLLLLQNRRIFSPSLDTCYLSKSRRPPGPSSDKHITNGVHASENQPMHLCFHSFSSMVLKIF